MNGVAASTVTVLAPLKAGAQDRLLARLAAFEQQQSPFARVSGTHFARWVYIAALSGADGEQLESQGSFLLMNAEFDSTLAEWTEELCDNSGPALDAVMEHCEGYPGSDDPTAVTAFFADHAATPGFTVAGHRRARVEEIKSALQLREKLAALVLRWQTEQLPAAELRAAWKEAVGQ